MNSRMDKYAGDSSVKQRTKRNENLYNDVLDMSFDYVDIDVNNAIELSPNEKNRSTREDFQKERELSKILPKNEERKKIIEETVEPKENRIYDINEILKLAHENKLFEDSDKKRLINTEYNILTKLDINNLESEDMKKEDLKSLINDIYDKEEPEKLKKYSKKEESELLNDLFATDVNDSISMVSLREELSKEILDNSTSKEEIVKKESYDKDDNDKLIKEDVIVSKDEIDDSFEYEKEGKGLLIAIIVVTILIMITGLFFLYEYFFGM